jgi:hypothetical protein
MTKKTSHAEQVGTDNFGISYFQYGATESYHLNQFGNGSRNSKPSVQLNKTTICHLIQNELNQTSQQELVVFEP